MQSITAISPVIRCFFKHNMKPWHQQY